MKISWKSALGVGGFLAGLCGVLGLAIAGGDMLTRDIIAKNKLEKEAAALKTVFGGEAEYFDATAIEDEAFPTLQKYWTVLLPSSPSRGHAFEARVYSASGKNAYGQVSLLIGVYEDFSLGNVAVLENTESYGQTLQDEYLDKYDAAEDKEKAVDAVKCGATEGAKLCRSLMRAAQDHYRKENAHE